MTTQHPLCIAPRALAALAIAAAFAFGIAGAAATPALADQNQWMHAQPRWSDQSNDWRRHVKWPTQHHRRHFNNGFNGCFGACGPRIVLGSGGVVFSSPGLIILNPGFIVTQPGFVVRQPGFVVRQPAFIVGRPNIILGRPGFAAKKDFLKRHPLWHLGQPLHHKPWKHKPWSNGHMSMGQGGVRIIAPGMN